MLEYCQRLPNSECVRTDDILTRLDKAEVVCLVAGIAGG